MSRQTVPFLSPAGRIVSGDLYKANTTDGEGRPKLIKNGPNQGKPTQSYDFGLAVPKGAETHWNQTAWGALLYNAGIAAWPQGQTGAPTFAWKVADGDSQVPNRKGRKNADREGYPRHWVLFFSSQFPPMTARLQGSAPVPYPEPNGIKRGYWAQVSGSIVSNESHQNPGMYLNHSMVCMVGMDTEITSGPDLATAGFGTGVALPAGIGMNNFNLPNPAAMATLPTLPPYVPAPAAPVQQVAQLQPQIAVQSHPGFLSPGVPGVPATPAVALPPPVPQSPLLTPKANGATYAQMVAAGWNDGLLRQHGYMA